MKNINHQEELNTSSKEKKEWKKPVLKILSISNTKYGGVPDNDYDGGSAS